MEDRAVPGEAGRALVDDDVTLERRGLRRKVDARLVGRDLDVLVLDPDLLAPLPEDVLFVAHGTLRVKADLAPFLRRLELDLKARGLPEARLEGVRGVGLLPEGGRRNDHAQGRDEEESRGGRTPGNRAFQRCPRPGNAPPLQFHRLQLRRHPEGGLRLRTDLSDVDARRRLDEIEALSVRQDVEDAEVRDDAVHAAAPRQREAAALGDLRLARPVGVLHRDHEPARTRHEAMAPPIPFTILPGIM